MDYEKYMKTLDSVGESILQWADPERNFRGYTEVRACVCGGSVFVDGAVVSASWSMFLSMNASENSFTKNLSFR